MEHSEHGHHNYLDDREEHLEEATGDLPLPTGHEHGAHAVAGLTGGHDRHEGHSVAMFRDRFWLSLALTIPVVSAEPRTSRSGSATRPRRSRAATYVPAVLGHDRLPLRRRSSSCAVPSGELARPAARDDDPHLARHHRRLRDVVGGDARAVRGRDLVGARDPDHDHAARPLARDALDRPGTRRALGARRAAARHRRAGAPTAAPRPCRSSTLAVGRRRARPTRRPGPGRRRGRRGRRPTSTSR